MVNRDEAVSLINRFIQTKDARIIGDLFEQLCEFKQIPNSKEEVKAVASNPVILSFIVEEVLREVETIHHIYRVTDKYNQLISVF